jgi:hypothetical protein
MELEAASVIGLCVILALWYGVGHLYNRRRGQRLFHWLESGLDTLGGERNAGWIGSPASGARISVTRAASPFRRLEITLLLENREVPVLWLLERLRGKRDRLIMKATLRSPGSGEVEVGPSRRMAIRRDEQLWTRQTGPHGLVIAHQGSGAEQRAAALASWLETYGAYLDRFSWRKADPHVQLQVNVAGLLATSSKRFLADVQSAVGTAHLTS